MSLLHVIPTQNTLVTCRFVKQLSLLALTDLLKA